jgi:hypothetical protein
MSTKTRPAIKYKLLFRTKEDGYLYQGSDFKLYFCDHSGDDRHGDPMGPDACDDPPSPIMIESVKNPCKSKDAYLILREDGFGTLLAPRIYNKLTDLLKVLRFA